MVRALTCWQENGRGVDRAMLIAQSNCNGAGIYEGEQNGSSGRHSGPSSCIQKSVLIV
jgi:hypothetical protein